METQFDLQFLVLLFKRKLKLIGIIMGSTLAFFLLLYIVIPKKYKSVSQFTIYSRYFQNPLVREFISEQSDPGEMRNQRLSVIQQAMDDEFTDRIGEEFHIYKEPKTSPKRGGERETLKKNFEMFSMSADTYQIGFVWKDPQIALEVAKKMNARVVETLIEQRKKTLENVRDAIRGRMESMVLYRNSNSSSLSNVSRSQVEEELSQLQSQERELLQHYTDRHPKVQQLRARVRVLSAHLGRLKRGASPKSQPELLAGAEIEPGSKEVYQDLLKKYNYLNVAIDMERAENVNYFAIAAQPTLPLSPAAPRLGTFSTYGLGSGMLLTLFILLFSEILRLNQADLERRSKVWGIPHLGSLPRLNEPTPEKPSDSSLSLEKDKNGWN